jgi:flagellar hook-associated protein 2
MADEYLTSGQITFTGLGSGTDFDKLIEQLVEIERTHINRLEYWKSSWDAKVEAFQILNTQMLSLKTTVEGMDTLDEFLIKNASSTDSSVVTATADSDADAASHTIEVDQLATNDIWVGQTSYSSETAAVTTTGDKVFQYDYDGTNDVAVDVPDNTTLEGLVNIINTDPDNPGIRASILKVADGDFRLQIRGLDLGSDYQFSVDDAETTLSGADSSDFVETQNASNSQFKVNGFPTGANDWISRSSNTVSDVIEGLTLNLKGAGTATVNVNVDNTAIKESVRTFVSQTNEVRATIKELTEFDEATEQGSILTGNYGVQLISSKLKNITATKGKGFDYNDDTYSVLSQLGITTDAEQGSETLGQLLLDETKLDEALSADPDAVAELFAADFIGDTNSSDFRYYSHIDGVTEAGVYDVEYTVAGGSITSATINGHAAGIDGDQITGASGYEEAGLTILVQNLTDGSYTGEVRLKQGKAGELADSLADLTSSSSGPLHILEENYQDIMDNIDEKIDYEEKRIERMERDLRNRFANLEATLGYYNQLQMSLNSQIGQLPE